MYKEKSGNVNISQREDMSLYQFCSHMRFARNNLEKSRTTLTDDRIASLDALGFDWSILERRAGKKSFKQRIEDLKAYKEKNGHVNVKESDDKSLYKFCINTRHARNNPEKSKTVLSADRIASLDALGFEWTVRASKQSFAQRISDLRVYKEKHGHVDVSRRGDKSLYDFCSKMRCARNNPEKSNRNLSADRIASLDALGFEWTVKKSEQSFAQRLEDLRLYKEKHGHVNVKTSDDKSLYNFVSQMRRALTIQGSRPI